MVNAVVTLRCSKPDCTVSKTGVCAEGHAPLQACPFYGKTLEINNFDEDLESEEEEDIESEDDESDQNVKTLDLVELPSIAEEWRYAAKPRYH